MFFLPGDSMLPKRYRTVFFLFGLIGANAVLSGADRYEVAGGSFKAMREIAAPEESVRGIKPTILVTSFLHEGLISLDEKPDPLSANHGKTVLVLNKRKKPVPFRVLQLGPGDYCRLAIQLEERTTGYLIYYGTDTPKQLEVPAWSCEDGLLMETRRFQHCNTDDCDSVRKAFEQAVPIGADYVETVLERGDPVTAKRHIETAEKRIGQSGRSKHRSVVLRVRGDYLATIGEGEAAREVYREAMRAFVSDERDAERAALEGSASRRCEGYIKMEHFERALEILRHWQREYPGAALEGFITFLAAEYREKYVTLMRRPGWPSGWLRSIPTRLMPPQSFLPPLVQNLPPVTCRPHGLT